ncbi:plectin-like [Cloeon dipterum]|uniref:plectin-like n=1 Tax=Cloeon dipterum TaxID=197152 RepID=UPI00321F8846
MQGKSDYDENSRRFVKCMEESRKQKVELMESLRGKNYENERLLGENEKLAEENLRLKESHSKFRLQSQQELAEIEKQIFNLEMIATEGKKFQTKLALTEDKLAKQRDYFEKHLDQRNQEIANLEFSVSQLQNKLQQHIQSGKTTYEKRPDLKEAQLKRIQEANKQLCKEKSDLHERYQALALKNAEQDKKIVEYCEKLQKLESELKMNKEASLMNPSIQSQLYERQKREAKLLNRVQELMKGSDEKANKTSELQQLRMSVVSLQERLKKTEELNKALALTFQEAKDVAKESISKLESEKSLLEAEVRKTTELFAAEKEARENYASAASASKSRLEKLQTECGIQRASILEFKRVSEQMQELAATSKAELEKQSELGERLRKEADTLKSELESCKSECDVVKKERETLQSELKKAKNSEAASEAKFASLKEAVQKKTSAIKIQFEAASKELRKSKSAVSDLQKSLDETKGWLEDTQQELAAKAGENEQLRSKAREHEHEAKTLTSEIERLRLKEEELNEKIETLSTNLQKKAAELAEKDREIEKIKAKTASDADEVLKKEKASLETVIASLTEKNQQLDGKRAQLEEEVGKLRKSEETVRASLSGLQSENAALSDSCRKIAKVLNANYPGPDVQGGDAENHESPDVILESMLAAYESKLEEKDRKLASLAEQLDLLNQKIYAFGKEAGKGESLQGENANLQQKLKILMADKRRLETQVDELTAEKEKMIELLSMSECKILELESDREQSQDHEAVKEKFLKAKKVIKKQINKIQVLEQESRELKSVLLTVKIKECDLDDLKKQVDRQRNEISTLKLKEQQRIGKMKQAAKNALLANLSAGQTDLHYEGCMELLKGLAAKYDSEPRHADKFSFCKTLMHRLIAERNPKEIGQEIDRFLKQNATSK